MIGGRFGMLPQHFAAIISPNILQFLCLFSFSSMLSSFCRRWSLNSHGTELGPDEQNRSVVYVCDCRATRFHLKHFKRFFSGVTCPCAAVAINHQLAPSLSMPAVLLSLYLVYFAVISYSWREERLAGLWMLLLRQRCSLLAQSSSSGALIVENEIWGCQEIIILMLKHYLPTLAHQGWSQWSQKQIPLPSQLAALPSSQVCMCLSMQCVYVCVCTSYLWCTAALSQQTDIGNSAQRDWIIAKVTVSVRSANTERAVIGSRQGSCTLESSAEKAQRHGLMDVTSIQRG